MHCTAAPRLEATVPDRESGYALEGTLAHAYCAMKLKSFLKQDTAAEEKEIAVVRISSQPVSGCR